MKVVSCCSSKRELSFYDLSTTNGHNATKRYLVQKVGLGGGFNDCWMAAKTRKGTNSMGGNVLTQIVLAASTDGFLYGWDLRMKGSDRSLFALRDENGFRNDGAGAGGGLSAVSASACGRFVLSGSEAGSLSVWDVRYLADAMFWTGASGAGRHTLSSLDQHPSLSNRFYFLSRSSGSGASFVDLATLTVSEVRLPSTRVVLSPESPALESSSNDVSGSRSIRRRILPCFSPSDYYSFGQSQTNSLSFEMLPTIKTHNHVDQVVSPLNHHCNQVGGGSITTMAFHPTLSCAVVGTSSGIVITISI